MECWEVPQLKPISKEQCVSKDKPSGAVGTLDPFLGMSDVYMFNSFFYSPNISLPFPIKLNKKRRTITALIITFMMSHIPVVFVVVLISVLIVNIINQEGFYISTTKQLFESLST